MRCLLPRDDLRLACLGIFAGDEDVRYLIENAKWSYGVGFGSSVTCFVFLLAFVLGVISLVPDIATTEVS